MKRWRFWGLAALLLAALFGVVPLLPPPPAVQDTLPPWQAVSAGQHWEIMGWSLGAATPRDVQARLGTDIQWAIVRRPDAPIALEGWVADFAAQGITGKLLLHFALPEPLAQQAAVLPTDGVKVTVSGNLQWPFDPLKADALWQTVPLLTQIAFLPTARLDEATLTARFAHLGTPTRWSDETGAQHLLYTVLCPMPCQPLGVHLLLPAQEGGRPLIEYAPHEAFSPLLLPKGPPG